MIRRITCLSVLFLFSVSIVSAQKSAFQKSEDMIRMFNAEQRFYAGDYQAALNTYTDLLVKKPTDANILFHIAECQFKLGQYALSLENAKKSKNADAKGNEGISLLLGQLYHKEGNLDEALNEFNAYKAVIADNPKKIKESDVELSISQVSTAKALMAAPVSVNVLNATDLINSEYDEKAPSITADGKTLVFTSRRPGKSSALDIEGDKKYFEDVYFARWDYDKKAFVQAELLPGSINTDGHDACTSISPDGKEIYIYKNDIDGESRGGDIYVSKVSSSGRWGAPRPLGKPINTTYFEGGACVSPDGNTLYFVSERPGGYGHADIYMAKRKDRTLWDTPVNLGADVNTSEDEGGIFLAADGKTLFFTSQGYNSMGGYDIFKTVNENGKWSKPVNLGYPINTINNDMSLTLSADAQTAYFVSDRKGGLGDLDIYKADLSNYAVLEKEMKSKTEALATTGILKGTVFNATDGTAMEAEVVILDEAGTKIGSTLSASGTGEYFITLPTSKVFEVKITVEGFKPSSEKIEIKATKGAEVPTLVKHYLLNKN